MDPGPSQYKDRSDIHISGEIDAHQIRNGPLSSFFFSLSHTKEGEKKHRTKSALLPRKFSCKCVLCLCACVSVYIWEERIFITNDDVKLIPLLSPSIYQPTNVYICINHFYTHVYNKVQYIPTPVRFSSISQLFSISITVFVVFQIKCPKQQSEKKKKKSC